MVVALGWAVFTQHVWEDYYITYRASKNLATGHGLTFTQGERVHSFTSPLGVLLPAAASLLTGNSSDTGALWIFRLFAAAALGGALYLLITALTRGVTAGLGATGLIGALVLTDAKTIDYTINGMETALLLLFIAWLFWAWITEPERRWVHLGLAWAGLMWTRPDAFVYIGALALAALVFQPVVGSWRNRALILKEYLQAGALTTLLYLPWLGWAWWYYGSPIPHTITAKGLFSATPSAGFLMEWLVRFPERAWANPSILAGTFMPAYSYTTGWPMAASKAAAVIAAVAMLLWLVPRLRWEARVASFGAFAGQFYLHALVGFPVPWYLPVVTFLSLIALGLALAQVMSSNAAVGWRIGARTVAGVLVTGSGLLALATAWQLRVQQRIIETGNRQQIGEWLKTQATSPRDTVFLEPLGYIGFFSNLKMLDFPGLSSPEVVASRKLAEAKAYPYCWSEVILDLQPDWLVLRPHERESIQGRDPELLARFYEPAKVFDVRPEVDAVRFLPGRGYLTNDAYFEVYRRRAGLPANIGLRRVKETMLTRREAWGQPAYDSGLRLQSHAPSLVEFKVTPGSRWLSGGLGLLGDAYATPPDATDGADFSIVHVSETGKRTVLLQRALRPVNQAGDRGTQSFRVEIPEGVAGMIELRTDQGPYGSNAYDWTYWWELTLETPQTWRQPR